MLVPVIDALHRRLVFERPVDERDRLGLYPFPLSLLVERGLHFLARLEPA